MKQKLYIESSVISYYTSRPSRDLIVAGHQQITQQWWDQQLSGYDPNGDTRNMHARRTNRRKPINSDPIIEEVRRVRKEIEAEHGNDWKALERYFTDKQNNSTEKKAAYKPRKLPKRKAI